MTHRRAVAAAILGIGVLLWWLGPLWVQATVALAVVLGWAVARTRPADRSILGHAADLAARAILAAAGRVLSGAALAIGVLLVLLALGDLVTGWLDGQLHAAVHAVTPSIPTPAMPSWVPSWLGGAR